MFERIIEIIVYVISELKQNKHISDIDVNELQQLGYTSSEISTAFSWLVDRIEFTEELFTRSNAMGETSFRVFHDAERDLFTSEAWGELIQMHSLGIITNEHIEKIIERSAMAVPEQIDSRQLKTMVAAFSFNAETDSAPGRRIMLNGSDTIN
ncbi:MAG: DUF494 family protein [Candidatus Kapaibacterium sp.]